MLAALVLAQLLAVTCIPAENGMRSDAPPGECKVSWSGHYANGWGFELTIPEGLVGIPNSPVSGCGAGAVTLGDHGLLIQLSPEPEPDHWIEAYGAFNAAELATAEESAQRAIGWIRERATNVRVTHRGAVVVSGVRGVRTVVRYRDRKLQQHMVEDHLAFLRGGTGSGPPTYQFSLYLRTPAEKYEAELRVFERVLATVRLTRPDY